MSTTNYIIPHACLFLVGKESMRMKTEPKWVCSRGRGFHMLVLLTAKETASSQTGGVGPGCRGCHWEKKNCCLRRSLCWWGRRWWWKPAILLLLSAFRVDDSKAVQWFTLLTNYMTSSNTLKTRYFNLLFFLHACILLQLMNLNFKKRLKHRHTSTV